jgi:glycosyltransferase involved in cell wall biosynthesis
MKRLSIVVEELNTSGGLRVLTEIANVASQAGCEVTLYCPDYSPKPFFPVNQTVKIRALSTGRHWRRLRYGLAIARKRLTNPDIFLTSSYRLIIVIALIGLMMRRPRSLFLIQGVDRISLIDLASTPLLGRLINRNLLALSGFVPCDRLYVSEFLGRTLKKKGRVIPNFVTSALLDSTRRSSSISTKVRIGYVGTSAPNKGFDLFLEASRLLIDDLKSSHSYFLEFACATQDAELIHQFATSGIFFVSPISDLEMRDFYESCQILLSLSISEGFGLPVLEAMACGCATVCSDSGGVTDFLRDGENGLLLTERSGSVAASAVDKLLRESALRERLAAAGRATARQYSYMRFSENYVTLFRDLGLL